ncbi:MAG: carbohydrate ABC transporter permease [Burkholderiaceae bacterium]|jgi:multiple sugar transport system permease protein
MTRSKLRLTPRWAPFVLLLPFSILFAVFGVFPLLFSVVLAFQSWEPTNGLASMSFVGLENFTFALGDEWFWKSLGSTFTLALLSGVPQHLVAIPLAAFIDRAFGRWRDPVSAAYFLPYITSSVAIAILFGALFSKDFGLVNSLLLAVLQGENIDWIGRSETLGPVVAFIVFWRYVGFNLVLYLAALQSIPRDLYEAAELDGANAWQQFFHITLPGLRPMILFGVTLSVIGGLQIFEEPFILTGGKGGPDQVVMTVGMYVYRTAFEFNDFGAASAMSWILCAIVAVLTWLTHRAFKSGEAAR